jgi:hypothetical protein
MNPPAPRLLALAVVLALTAAARADAAFLLGGSRLAITNKLPDDATKNRLGCLAKGLAIVVPSPGSSGDPTCIGAGGGGGSITFHSASSGQTVTSPLPCANWHSVKGGSGYRYLDRQLDDGPCRVIEIKQGRLLRALCHGRGATTLDFDLVAGQPQPPVDVSLRVGSAPQLYCLSFGGKILKDGSDGKAFLAKDAPPPAVACSPSGAFLDGPIGY